MNFLSENKYISDSFLFSIYAVFISIVWIVNSTLFFAFGFEPFLSNLFSYFEKKQNLNMFILLCLPALTFHLFGLLINYQIFRESFKTEKVKIYWSTLLIQFFIHLILGVFAIFIIINSEISLADNLPYTLFTSIMAFGIVGLFFYVARFLLIKN